MGSAAFFAPLICTVPFNGWPPSMIILSIYRTVSKIRIPNKPSLSIGDVRCEIWDVGLNKLSFIISHRISHIAPPAQACIACFTVGVLDLLLDCEENSIQAAVIFDNPIAFIVPAIFHQCNGTLSLTGANFHDKSTCLGQNGGGLLDDRSDGR